MAKCVKCGKKGLFLKLNKEHICKDCEWQAVVDQKDAEISELNFQLLPEQQDIKKLNDEIKKLSASKTQLSDSLLALEQELTSINNSISEKKKEIIVLDDEILYQSFGLYTPLFDFAKSEDYADKLKLIRDQQKAMIKNETACKFYNGWTLNGSQAQGRKMTKDNIKQILRCFNAECDEIVDKVKFSNVQSMRERINKSFEQLNKINNLNQVSITPAYRNLKLDELSLSYEYQLKKQQEKEELKEQKRALREQAKLEAEIRAAREQLEKDRKHFKKAISDIEYKLKFATSEEERNDLNEKLKETQSQMLSLDDEENKINYREQNAKAGYVYIISNIGAFGEGVYKIGMTRRLDPMERIEELSSASVPFEFDIHALLFSDNAPELEAKLHKHFEKDRINKINFRKEFYRTSIDEIESVIKQNYDKTVEILKTPAAEEYRESLMASSKDGDSVGNT